MKNKEEIDKWHSLRRDLFRKIENKELPEFENKDWQSLALGFLMGSGISPEDSLMLVKTCVEC